MKKGFQRPLNLDFYLSITWFTGRTHYFGWRPSPSYLLIVSLDVTSPWRDFWEIKHHEIKSDCVKGTPTLSVIRERWRPHFQDTSMLEMRPGFPNSKTEHVLWQWNSMFSTTLPGLLQNNKPGWFAHRKPTAQLWRVQLRMRECWLGGRHALATVRELMTAHNEMCPYEKQILNATECQSVYMHAFPDGARAA